LNYFNLDQASNYFIKRDDLADFVLSGNKARKLEFLLADAIDKGSDCVITVGGIQSNHCRATGTPQLCTIRIFIMHINVNIMHHHSYGR
jgi:D-cysteine desulfhydrase